MSRRSRTDAYLRIWLKFPEVQREQGLVTFEERLKAWIEAQGFSVYHTEFIVKDAKAVPADERK